MSFGKLARPYYFEDIDFTKANAGTATFTISGLTTRDVVIVSPNENEAAGQISVAQIAADTLTLRNDASETSTTAGTISVLVIHRD